MMTKQLKENDVIATNSLGKDGGRTTIKTGIEIGSAQEAVSKITSPHFFMKIFLVKRERNGDKPIHTDRG